MEAFRAAVVGVGHLGRIHARVYHELPGVELIGIVDPDPERAAAVAADFGVEVLPSAQALVGKVDGVSIAAPTSEHYALARIFLEAGIPVLVEKPMTATLEEGRELLALSEERGVPIQVGHVERFNPAVMAAERHIGTPLFIEAHRLSPFSFRSADIDVVLDLMIHDLDIISHLVGASLEKVEAVGVSILSDKVDIANARLTYANGCVANVTASRVSAKKMRKIRVFSQDAYVSLDYGDRRALVFRKTPEVQSGELRMADLAAMPIDNPLEFFLTKVIQVEEIEFDEHEPLKKEAESFVEAVSSGGKPSVSAEEGLNAMIHAEKVKEAIDRHLEFVQKEGKILHGKI